MTQRKPTKRTVKSWKAFAVIDKKQGLKLGLFLGRGDAVDDAKEWRIYGYDNAEVYPVLITEASHAKRG